MRISDWSSDVCSSDLVYSYIKDGVRHYTSKRPKGVEGATALRTIRYSFLETCFACASSPGVNFNTLRLNTSAYSDEISKAARQYGVEEAVVRAVIHAESAFNPNALSRVGAQGLMPLMRSEEHTSELQSLMHISYAVFCLKK